MINMPYLMVLVESLFEFEMNKKENKKDYTASYNRNFYFKSVSDAFQISQINGFNISDQNLNDFFQQILVENPHLFILTPPYPSKQGAIWSKFPLNLNKSFIIDVWINFIATQGVHPADGICFVLQNKGIDIVGKNGYDTGYGGMQGESVAIRLNTYDDINYNIGQHIRFCKNGNVNDIVGCMQPVPSNYLITDNNFHEMTFAWNVNTQTFTVYFDEKIACVYSIDLRDNFPNSLDKRVYWGFTGATGDCYSMQTLYIQSIQVF